MKDNYISDHLDQELKNIIVNDALKKEVLLRCSGNHVKNYRRFHAVAIGIVMVSILILTSWNNIVTAIEPLVKYIPGINAMTYDSNTSNTFALDGTIKTQFDDKYIEIMSCFTEGNIVEVVIHSNIVFDEKNTITAVDMKDKNGKIISEDVISDGKPGSDAYSWIGTINLQFGNAIDSFNLRVGEYEVPVILTKVVGVHNFEDYGNVAYYNGIRVAAFTKYVEDLLEVRLAGLSDSAGKIQSFANNDIYVVDREGNRYNPITPPNMIVSDNIYYFKARLKDDLKIIIPYITLVPNDNGKDRNSKSEEIIKIPPNVKSVALDQSFKLGAYGLSIVKVERISNPENINMRTKEGKRITVPNLNKNGLKIIIDKKYSGSDNEGIYDFSCDYDSKYGPSLTKVDGIKMYYSDASKITDPEYEESRYKVIYLQNVSIDTDCLKVTFEKPVFIRKGNWEINLKK